MANFVTTSDFNGGTTNIPNLDMVGVNLTAYITKYEEKFLRELLGDDLYTALRAAPTEARFIALLVYLKPAIIDYVFYYYIEDNGGTMLLGVGSAKSKNTNATLASSWPVMVKVWNEMVDYNKKTNKFLHDNTTYPEYTINLPPWFFCEGIYMPFYWPWFWEYGYKQIPENYRVKNGLGI